MEFQVNGPRIIFTIPILGGIPVTETVTNAWIVMAVITALCILLTRKMKVRDISKTQIVAEYLVNMVVKLVDQTMGPGRQAFVPYIAALFAFSLFSSLSSLFTLRAPTADINTTAAWAIITFLMIQVTKIKTKKVVGYLKSFGEPVVFITPLNIISEFSFPVSLSFRHFGNIAGGMVITSMLYWALGSFTQLIFGVSVPFLQVGIPAFLSIYFDLFTSFMQAFIFCMLTMAFVGMAGD